MDINAQALKKMVKEELPGLMKRDKQIRQFIINLTKEQLTDVNEKTDKLETKMDKRFDRLLDELRRDREEQTRKWDEQRVEDKRKWEEQNRKWEEQRVEDKKKWDEQTRNWEEQNRKWDENQKEIRKLYQSIEKAYNRLDSGIGAIGARWGLRSEASFRNAMKGILKDFDIEIINVDEYDDDGEVFGRPDNVELDIILTNGMLTICELKSSMSKGDIYTFYKKAAFYEKRHNRKADRLIVISPMVIPKAVKVARELGITVYSYADQMGEDFTSTTDI